MSGAHVSPEALQRRRDRNALRRALKTQQRTLASVLLEPPDALKDQTLIDIVVMAQRWTRNPKAILATLGECALEDGVNLLEPLGEAGIRARWWLAEYDPWATGYDEYRRAA